MEFFYDHTGVFAVKYNGSTYFYRRNAQQDVIAILDITGAVVVKYKYDAWGNCTITLNTNGIAVVNPIRYRGYYYDQETKLYYLNARYYCPAWNIPWIMP